MQLSNGTRSRPRSAPTGCTCRPCIEHHIPAGREAGLSERACGRGPRSPRAVRDEAAIELLAGAEIDELSAAAPFLMEPALLA